MDWIAKKVTNFYVKRNYVPEDKQEVYCYGFKLIIADIINFFLVMLLGMILRRFVHSILFLITLCTVRQFSGGFHAKTFWLCRISMLITFIAVTLITVLIYNFNACNIVLNIVSVIIIGIFSPIKHPNKSLTQQQKKKNKFKAIITSFVFAIISSVLIIIGADEGVTISITLSAIVVLMGVGILVQKGGEENV